MEKLHKKTPLYSCRICNYNTVSRNNYIRHSSTAKHIKRANGDREETEKLHQKTPRYYCDTCDFITNNNNDYTRHLSTEKHKNRPNGVESSINNTDGYQCGCGKIYAVSGSLWRHKKKCSLQSNYTSANILHGNQNVVRSDSNRSIDENNHDGINYTIQENTQQNTQQLLSVDMFMDIMKQNKELQNLLVEEVKFLRSSQSGYVTNNNTINNNAHSNNTNSNNSFNLNVFLNEHCKDAINMSEFIQSLVITSEDLERTGKVGFVKSMSEIFIKGLKQLDVNKRPIHCTDLKRESIYMKDHDKWEKETDDKSRFYQAIQKLTMKNIKQLKNWEIENPEFSDVESETYDRYFRITKHFMGGIGEDDKKFKDKIITNVIHSVKIPQ
jgi:hypothetical protein